MNCELAIIEAESPERVIAEPIDEDRGNSNSTAGRQKLLDHIHELDTVIRRRNGQIRELTDELEKLRGQAEHTMTVGEHLDAIRELAATDEYQVDKLKAGERCVAVAGNGEIYTDEMVVDGSSEIPWGGRLIPLEPVVVPSLWERAAVIVAGTHYYPERRRFMPTAAPHKWVDVYGCKFDTEELIDPETIFPEAKEPLSA